MFGRVVTMLTGVAIAFVLAVTWIPHWVERRGMSGPPMPIAAAAQLAPVPAAVTPPVEMPELLFGPHGMRAVVFAQSNTIVLSEVASIKPRVKNRRGQQFVRWQSDGETRVEPLPKDTALVITFDLQSFLVPLPSDGVRNFALRAKAEHKRTTVPLYDLLHLAIFGPRVAQAGASTNGTSLP